ncbi:MAG: MG2 domain-containing protein, partial [Myxococcota bacterium]
MRRSTANPLVIAAAPVAVVLCAMLASVSLCVGFPCVTTGLRYGMWPDECPATDLRLDVTASAQGLLRRQDGGVVQIVPQARWLSGDDRDAYEQSSVLLRGMSWTVTLQDEHGEAVPGLELGRARRSAGLWIPAKLPDIPDGDYVLHVEVDAGFESATVDVPVPVYAPAVVHAMTDRPLYKPGQDVLLRSVALRRSDLRPLAGRPGKWQILDPEGNEMLLERDRASDWGVADGSFPLDTSSAIGTWTARWVTGDAVDTVPFEVRPFRLPRFVVDAAPDRRWYRIGDAVVIEGRAVYTSGAPVADAPVEVQLAATEGRWPLPLDWEEVHTARTSADGRYRVTIGAVPPDLMDRTVAAARVAVTDKTGEVAQGAGTVVLSDRSLRLETMTELGGGLVAGFNNRMYLRVSTPDGTPLPDAELLIRRPYDPTDPGKPATTDVDGVATVQLDPGAPVTVVEPAPPVRVRPVHAPPPSLSSAREATTGSLDLEERRAFDAVIPAVAPCSTFAIGDRSVSVGVQVGASGAVRKTVADDDPLSACVARAMGRLSMPAGGERTYAVEWGIPDAQLPSIAWAPTTVFQLGGSSVDGLVGDAGVAARACLGPGQGIDGAEVVVVHWAVDRGATAVTT